MSEEKRIIGMSINAVKYLLMAFNAALGHPDSMKELDPYCNKRIKEFKKDIAEKDPEHSFEKMHGFTEANTLIIPTDGYGYKDIIAALDKCSIPCLAWKNDNDGKVFVSIPKVEKEAARAALDKLPRLSFNQPELSQKYFSRANQGCNVITVQGITEYEQFLIRTRLTEQFRKMPLNNNLQYMFKDERLNNKGINVCTMAFPARCKDDIIPVVLKTMAECRGVDKERIISAIDAKMSMYKTAKAIVRDPSASLYIIDANNPDIAIRLGNDKAVRVNGNGIKTPIKCPSLEACAQAYIYGMSAPVIKREKASHNMRSVEGLFTKEEIAAAKKSMAETDMKVNGNVHEAQVIAATAMGLIPGGLSGAFEDLRASNVKSFIQNCISYVQDDVEDMYKRSLQELLEAYDKCNMSPEEDANIVDMLESIYGENKFTSEQCTANWFVGEDLGKAMDIAADERDFDYSREDRSNDRETDAERNVFGD